MRDRLTSLIAIALLVTLCAMSYWYSVKAELENVTHLSDLNSPDFIARDITITQFDDDGIAKAKVFAKEVEHYSDGHANAKFLNMHRSTRMRPKSLRNPTEPQWWTEVP